MDALAKYLAPFDLNPIDDILASEERTEFGAVETVEYIFKSSVEHPLEWRYVHTFDTKTSDPERDHCCSATFWPMK
jgi:hypothetical protein